MSDNHAIATKLEEYLDADYFAGAIKNVHALINHIAFLEKSGQPERHNRPHAGGEDR